jgi:nucleolar protein 53
MRSIRDSKPSEESNKSLGLHFIAVYVRLSSGKQRTAEVVAARLPGGVSSSRGSTRKQYDIEFHLSRKSQCYLMLAPASGSPQPMLFSAHKIRRDKQSNQIILCKRNREHLLTRRHYQVDTVSEQIMGKKLQGAKLRARKRAKEALEELQEHQAEHEAALTVTTKPDADLFVVDTKGETVPHHKRPTRAAKHKKPTGLSAQDQKQVEALLQKHGAAKIKEIAEKGRKMLENHKRRTRSSAAHKTHTNFDLWDAPTDTLTTRASKKMTAAALKDQVGATQVGVKNCGIGSTMAGTAPAHVVVSKTVKLLPAKPLVAVAVDVAVPGQSYHPDPVAHKELIRKAAAVEVAREQAVAAKEAPLSQGLSAETKAILLGDSEDEESEDEHTGEIPNAGAIPKRANKLTKAQRNKQKRLRVEQAIQRKAKLNKKLLNEVSEIPRYKKEITKVQKSSAQQKDEKLALQQAKAAIPAGKDVELKAAQHDPVNAPTLPVALPTELRSSLRTIKPKGSLATDRVLSMAARSQIQKRSHTEEATNKRKASKKRRKLAVKGKHNRDAIGDNFELLG